MSKSYYVYILSNFYNTTTYIGVINDLARRITEHKQGLQKGFSQKYKINKLVYCEIYQDVREAIYREKCLKRWKREWKVDLINQANPQWNDIFEGL